jgi:hypothetical protein
MYFDIALEYTDNSRCLVYDGVNALSRCDSSELDLQRSFSIGKGLVDG